MRRGQLCARAPELRVCPRGLPSAWRASAVLRTGAHEVHVRDRLLFHRPDGDVQLHVSTSAWPRPARVCARACVCACERWTFLVMFYFDVSNLQKSYKNSVAVIQTHSCKHFTALASSFPSPYRARAHMYISGVSLVIEEYAVGSVLLYP